MGTGGKIVVAVAITSSALVAAWLLTGTRKDRTKQFVAKRSAGLRIAPRPENLFWSDDQETYYI
jgi:hypothetical protein